MPNPEINHEIEIGVEKEVIKFLHDELLKEAELEYDDEEIRPFVESYLKEVGKNIMELTQEDKENIFADLLQWGWGNITE